MNNPAYTQDATLAALAACTSAHEWRAFCDAMKRANNGGYPSWWFEAMIQSGAIDRACIRFGTRPGITAICR